MLTIARQPEHLQQHLVFTLDCTSHLSHVLNGLTKWSHYYTPTQVIYSGYVSTGCVQYWVSNDWAQRAAYRQSLARQSRGSAGRQNSANCPGKNNRLCFYCKKLGDLKHERASCTDVQASCNKSKACDSCLDSWLSSVCLLNPLIALLMAAVCQLLPCRLALLPHY